MISIGNVFPLFCLPLTSISALICLARRQHQCLMGRSCSVELDRSTGDWLTTSQYSKARSVRGLLFSRAPLCLARSGEGRHCPCICCTNRLSGNAPICRIFVPWGSALSGRLVQNRECCLLTEQLPGLCPGYSEGTRFSGCQGARPIFSTGRASGPSDRPESSLIRYEQTEPYRTCQGSVYARPQYPQTSSD